MDLLLQLLADQLQAPVERPVTTETTALGAATLAGLAVGVWGSLDELASLWKLDARFEPRTSRAGADSKHASWLSARRARSRVGVIALRDRKSGGLRLEVLICLELVT